jgi:hypothetical protein
MLESITDVFSRFHPLVAAEPAVVIRAAHDADVPSLHDLAELDSAVPLAGRVLVALVDERPWAAVGLDDGRIIADPFRPTGAAVELLRLRAAQLDGRARRWVTWRRGLRGTLVNGGL